eukprot:Skav236157  [mRNA]  locus=scaffold4035:22823:23167:+ [translate_table: standard]
MAAPVLSEAVEHALVTTNGEAAAANPENQAHVDMVMAVVRQLCEGNSMSSREARASGGGMQYKLNKLIEGLLGRLLKSASDLPTALVRSIGFLLGPQAAELCRAGIAQGKIDIP